MSDKNLTIKFKADIYAIGKDNKHYLIEVKKRKDNSLANDLKSCGLMKNKIKEIDELLIITEKDIPLTKKHFEEIKINIVNFNQLGELENILKKKTNKKFFNSKIKENRISLGLSQYQLANLLDVNTKSIENWENLKHKRKISIGEGLKNINKISLNKGLPHLQFLANKSLLIKNSKNIELRFLRNELKLTQKELAKKMEVSKRILQQFENGRVKSKKLEKKVLLELKKICNSKESFNKIRKEAKIKYLNYLEYWKTAEKIRNIVKINIPYNNKGLNFENDVEQQFKSLGYKIIRNAVISNNNGKWTSEIDIILINKFGEISLVSCVKNNDNIYKKINELKFIGGIINNPRLILTCKDNINSEIINRSRQNLGIKIIDNFNVSSDFRKNVLSQIMY